ncbi:MAG: uroporphyrinogen decarboxylase [Methyloceanibacter sp.]|uniref:uroporphyrinogen decarboxylase n=1 Tax=Methyloceanibacter sp. TaxID=1965321 RepID=UPI003D6D58C3
MLRTPSSPSPLLQALGGHVTSPPPVWLMRQAGRYLPEYRSVRNRVPSFLDLCLNPALAAEVTLQPLRRFAFDAAIVFSDILIVPYALGQKVEFKEGEGPKLEAIRDADAVAKLDTEGAGARLAPVYETVERATAELPETVPLIGFCGAPWTVATYMVEGGGSKEHLAARFLAYHQPETFQRLIDILVEISAHYLAGQAKAGARVLQIFDSWAGVLSEDEFTRWCIAPTRQIVQRVKAEVPGTPIIGFPRGAGLLAERYARDTGIDAIGCDTAMPVGWMQRLQVHIPVQGNLDPVLLLAGGAAFDARVEAILGTLGAGPFIFNLGHGILPDTPVENVERLVSLVTTWQA